MPRGQSGYVIVKRDTWEGVEVKWELCISILRENVHPIYLDSIIVWVSLNGKYIIAIIKII